MTEDILHTIDFVEQEEHKKDGYSECVYRTDAGRALPLPSEGELVSFGWHTEGGERAERVDLHAAGRSDSDVGYEKSATYRVVGVEYHYHRAQETANGKLAVNLNEVGTTVIITEATDV